MIRRYIASFCVQSMMLYIMITAIIFAEQGQLFQANLLEVAFIAFLLNIFRFIFRSGLSLILMPSTAKSILAALFSALFTYVVLYIYQINNADLVSSISPNINAMMLFALLILSEVLAWFIMRDQMNIYDIGGERYIG